MSNPVEQHDASVIATPRWRSALRGLLVTIYLLGFFAGCLWLYTRNNTFPLEFHPDEPGKVMQLLGGDRNYRHPQLMLEATTLWCRWMEVPTDGQSTVIAGRQVTAFFGAAAATLLAFTAFLCAGIPGLIIGSLLIGLCPPILIYSHYLKEDTSLLLGISLVIAAARLAWMSRRRWFLNLLAWGLLACGCAIACSGKYVGAMSISFAVLLLGIAPGRFLYRPVIRLLFFLLMFALVLGWINQRALNPAGLDLLHVLQQPSDWQSLFDPAFLRGLEYETTHSQTSHWGLTANRPNTYVLRSAISQSWPIAAIAAAGLPLVLWLTRKRGWGWEALLILFTAICTLVLSYSIILFPRYALPVVAMLHLMAAIAIARLILAMEKRRVLQGTALILSAAGLAAILAPVSLDCTWQFGHDSRYALAEWATANLPRNARVFADDYAELHYYGASALARQRGDVQLRTYFILPQMPGFGYESRNGEAYYVICDTAYSRYFEPSAFPAATAVEQSRFAKAFYEHLLRNEKPVWEYVPRYNMNAYTNPVIKVYRLRPEQLTGFATNY